MNRNVKGVQMPMQRNFANLIIFLLFLLFSYLITTIGLVVLAYVLYRFPLNDSAVNIGIIIVYVLSTFLAAFVCGKKLKVRKFAWGLSIGIAYFVILLLISMIMGGTAVSPGTNVLTTLLICAGSGMLGGMLA